MELQFKSLTTYKRFEMPDQRSWLTRLFDKIKGVEQIKTYRYDVTIRFEQTVPVGSSIHGRFIIKNGLKPLYADNVFRVVDRQHYHVVMTTIAPTVDWLTLNHFVHARYIVANVPHQEASRAPRG